MSEEEKQSEQQEIKEFTEEEWFDKRVNEFVGFYDWTRKYGDDEDKINEHTEKDLNHFLDIWRKSTLTNFPP